jgi:hypothetical protein
MFSLFLIFVLFYLLAVLRFNDNFGIYCLKLEQTLSLSTSLSLSLLFYLSLCLSFFLSFFVPEYCTVVHESLDLICHPTEGN